MRARDLLGFGLVNKVIDEPLGGAHRDHHLMASRLKLFLRKKLHELTAKPIAELVEQRYEKFRRMGVFLDGASGGESTQEFFFNDSASAPPPHAAPDAAREPDALREIAQ